MKKSCKNCLCKASNSPAKPRSLSKAVDATCIALQAVIMGVVLSCIVMAFGLAFFMLLECFTGIDIIKTYIQPLFN